MLEKKMYLFGILGAKYFLYNVTSELVHKMDKNG